MIPELVATVEQSTNPWLVFGSVIVTPIVVAALAMFGQRKVISGQRRVRSENKSQHTTNANLMTHVAAQLNTLSVQVNDGFKVVHAAHSDLSDRMDGVELIALEAHAAATAMKGTE